MSYEFLLGSERLLDPNLNQVASHLAPPVQLKNIMNFDPKATHAGRGVVCDW